MTARRIAAVVMPELACEIARQRASVPGPLGIVLHSSDSGEEGEDHTAVLDVVDEAARKYGVRRGQKVTQAAALVADLTVKRVSPEELEAALGAVAEVALAFGPTSAIRLEEPTLLSKAPTTSGIWSDGPVHVLPPPSADGPFDTVWLDVTGSAHLAGGEDALLEELGERIAALGHRARLAISDGPRLAQALARWAAPLTGGRFVAPAGQAAEAMAALPLAALPIDEPPVARSGSSGSRESRRADREREAFFVRVGVLTVADLARLPRAAVSARLGARAPLVIDLVHGRDETPLVAYEPPRELVEEASFEEGVASVEALGFVLRGMVSRLAARLAGRGEACARLEIHAPFDRSIAKLRGLSTEALVLPIDLPAPLSDEASLFRALRVRLERAELPAPATGVRLVAPRITRVRRVQLDLSRKKGQDPDGLPALLGELSAEIGAERLGVLSIVDAFAPEGRSRLVPLVATGGAGVAPVTASAAPLLLDDAAAAPSRLLPEPAPLGAGVPGRPERGRRSADGAVVAVGRHFFAVESVRFVMRLDGVAWWTPRPVSRDYYRGWLAGAGGSANAEAWMYVDRKTGDAWLQGWFE